MEVWKDVEMEGCYCENSFKSPVTVITKTESIGLTRVPALARQPTSCNLTEKSPVDRELALIGILC
jgi:hypothetical protein